MQRKPLIAGNWKMHLDTAAACELASGVVAAAAGAADRQVMIAPPFTALQAVGLRLSGSQVQLAGQNVCWEGQGAFTGEISPLMLRDVGCSMVIVGHSERRQLFGETDAMVNRRLRGALQHGLMPLLCIGETLAEREAEATFDVLARQLQSGLAEVQADGAHRLVIAYEPVWAIGTGRTATVEQAQEAHLFIRRQLADLFEKKIASQIRILYGGSVNAGNVDQLMAQPDVDGALVGGAALKIESFERIINFQ